MKQIRPKGTRDFLPEEAIKLTFIENVLSSIVGAYNFKQMRTPIFEHTDVYVRSSGETSDIVKKEMYTFLDKGSRSITLRPEGTAGIIRSLVENKTYAEADLPLKYFYYGPNFRYERPQAGRYRQFNQFGVECIGVKNYVLDAEIIQIATQFLEFFNIKDYVVKINCIGDFNARKSYAKALQDHFKPYLDELCEDCKERINSNPLRILDCKVDANKKCMENCPSISSFLSDESILYYNSIKEMLKTYEINFIEDDRLVRGLDYYNDIVFEIHLTDNSGRSLGAILAGGRYDNLVKDFDGPDLPAIGFALGEDRLLEVLNNYKYFERMKDPLNVYIMPMNDACLEMASYIGYILRSNGFVSEIDYQTRSMKSQFKTVGRLNPDLIYIIGENELDNNTVTIKENNSGSNEQIEIPVERILSFMNDYFSRKYQHSCGCGHDHDGCDCECDDDCDCGCHEGHECGCGCHDHGDCGCGTEGCNCGECTNKNCECKLNGTCRCKEEGHPCDGHGCHNDGHDCCCGHNHECDDDCECGCHEGHECGCHDHGDCGCGTDGCNCGECTNENCECKIKGTCRCKEEGHPCDGHGCHNDNHDCCCHK